MTKGLLISRCSKNTLHKRYLIDPSNFNKSTYTNYRNIYNSLIRLSKKEHFADNLRKCKKNPKKTWEIFNEVINKKKILKKLRNFSLMENLLPTIAKWLRDLINFLPMLVKKFLILFP